MSSSRDCSRTLLITWQDSSRSNWITSLLYAGYARQVARLLDQSTSNSAPEETRKKLTYCMGQTQATEYFIRIWQWSYVSVLQHSMKYIRYTTVKYSISAIVTPQNANHYSLAQVQVNKLHSAYNKWEFQCNSFTVSFSTMQLHWVCY